MVPRPASRMALAAGACERDVMVCGGPTSRGRTGQELGVVGCPPAVVGAAALVPAGHAGTRIGHGRFEHLDGGAVPDSDNDAKSLPHALTRLA